MLRPHASVRHPGVKENNGETRAGVIVRQQHEVQYPRREGRLCGRLMSEVEFLPALRVDILRHDGCVPRPPHLPGLWPDADRPRATAAVGIDGRLASSLR